MNAIAPIQTEPVERSNRMVLAPSGMFSDPAKFEFAQRVAQVFASSNLVPAHLKGKLPDCLIALHMAERLGEDPLTTMQNIMVVNGRPGFMTSYMIARANRSGVFKGRITWATTGAGEALSVTANAVLAETEETVSATTSMVMAKAEGWTKNAKYQSMPEHMLRYRSAAMLIRLYCPEVMLGMAAVEELETGPAPMRDVTPRAPRPETSSPTPAASAKPPRPPAPPVAGPAETATVEKPAAASQAAAGDFPGDKAEQSIVTEFREACEAALTQDDLSEVMGDFSTALETASADERADMQAAYEAASNRIDASSTPLAAG